MPHSRPVTDDPPHFRMTLRSHTSPQNTQRQLETSITHPNQPSHPHDPGPSSATRDLVAESAAWSNNLDLRAAIKDLDHRVFIPPLNLELGADHEGIGRPVITFAMEWDTESVPILQTRMFQATRNATMEEDTLVVEIFKGDMMLSDPTTHKPTTKMVIDLPHLAEAARFSLRWGDEPLLDWAGTRRSVQVLINISATEWMTFDLPRYDCRKIARETWKQEIMGMETGQEIVNPASPFILECSRSAECPDKPDWIDVPVHNPQSTIDPELQSPPYQNGIGPYHSRPAQVSQSTATSDSTTSLVDRTTRDVRKTFPTRILDLRGFREAHSVGTRTPTGPSINGSPDWPAVDYVNGSDSGETS